MKTKLVFTFLTAALLLFIISVLRDNFKKYKIKKSKDDIDTFYSKLNSGYVNYFETQTKLMMLLENEELEKNQTDRLLATRDSLKLDFAQKTMIYKQNNESVRP